MEPACRTVAGGASFAPLVLANLIVPPTLLAIGIIELIRRCGLHGLESTDLPLLAGLACRFVPVAMLVMMMSWLRVPSDTMRAAVAHSMRWRDRLTYLMLSMYGPGMAWAAALCGLLIATELEISLMLIRPGTATLGVRLYSMIHTAPDPLVSAAALNVLLCIIAPCAILATIVWMKLRRAGGVRDA